MADDQTVPRADTAWLHAGDMLLWIAGSEADALAMGDHADRHDLGSWGCSPIGLGFRWHFDLQLDRDVPKITLILLYDRLPDHVY